MQSFGFQDFQSKLQSRVQGFNANLTDGAARLRQQLLQNTQTGMGNATSNSGVPAVPPAAAPEEQQQYLRLPVESAKKLRWIDRQDLNMLIELHLREKQELYQANSALREVLRQQGVGDAQLDEEVRGINATVDTMRTHEAGVGEVLVLAARAEVERLQDRVSALTAQVEAAQLQLAAGTVNSPQHWRRPSGSAPVTPGKQSADGGRETALDSVVDSGGAALADGGVRAAVLALLDALHAGGGGSSTEGDDAELLNSAITALQAHAGQAASPEGAGDASGSAADLRCEALQEQSARATASLAAAQQEAAMALEAAERQVAELRARASEAQQAQLDLLRVAQDGRLQAEARREGAESRAAAAEERAVQAEAEAKRLGQEVKLRQEEAASALARAAQADAATRLDKSRTAGSQQALAQHRMQVSELETLLASTQRQYAAARSQIEALEGRLTASEAAAARAAAVIHELEAVAAERDELATRLAASEARAEDLRANQMATQGLRDLAQQSEERRAQAEEELVTTAKLAASLEARLAAATAEIEQARLEAQHAAMRAAAAEDAVVRATAARWEKAGADRSRWPAVAQDEIENVEARLAAVNAAHKTGQAELASAVAARDAAVLDQATAEKRAAAAHMVSERVKREAEQREQRLQAAASAAALQVDEFRAAMRRLERERDVLREEKEARDKAASAAAAALAAAKRRTGSGSLGEEQAVYPTAKSNGDSAPSPLIRPPLRDTLDATDILYLKNVLLKFVDAHLSGREQEVEVLVPAVAALLRASPAEYRMLWESVQRAQQPLGWLYQLSTGTQ